ncbi:PAS domain S-box protein [Thermodesulfobacteriota bacterium]
MYKSLFENNYSVMLLIDPETGAINDANPSACLFYGYGKDKLTNLKITDINTLPKKEVFMEMEKAKSQKRNYFNFKHRLSNGTIRNVEVFSGPITISDKALLCSVIHDISERKSAEKERERLINELQNALSEVKKLRGFLPICAACKKIRDDKGYWNQIESYIRDHSEAEFTHSICPECAKKLYPGIGIKKNK